MEMEQITRISCEDGKAASGNVAHAETISNADHSLDRGTKLVQGVGEDGAGVHHHMSWQLFLSLVTMSFLWVGSQIPLYLFGSVLPLIYADIGGYDRYIWLVIGYLIPNAALCPFVGALSDMFGRRYVAIGGQILFILGPVVTATAKEMNIAIAGEVFSGLGAGLNELIALVGTAEMVPYRKRGTYIGAIILTILPFCPSVLWAQMIAKASHWRYVGIVVGVWNFIGLLLVVSFYKEPAGRTSARKRMDIIKEVDYIGGFLSTVGVLCFMMGMQWGAQQYSWNSAHVLLPFILGIVSIIAFFVWEAKFAPYPMVPAKLFSKDKRTMIAILLITFWSGGNYFVLLLLWPTQCYNVYGDDPIGIDIRALPTGFGIVFGAALVLILIPVVKGRTTPLMIFSCALMTAATGAISVGTPHNLSTLWGLTTIASIAVGFVIIPSSIIAQFVCSIDLIGTVTAITLSIRFIGGAVAFTAYDNVLYSKFNGYILTIVVPAIVQNGIVAPIRGDVIGALATLAAEAKFPELKETIAANPAVQNKEIAYDIVIGATQEAYALAFRYPYWISIAFGSISLVCSLFLKDIRTVLLAEN
ncbi:fungal trichothecene efflux pump [Aspergillus pseudoustus]|uniref:Fungal trichothecene efflux pump n=1 Tax=Aspergillus pseudoustus TaxID=1810923 RepID=A0ABR4JKB1_9EURO